MTISELMKDKKPGEVKIKYHGWTDMHFIPFFFEADTNVWHGLDESGMADSFDADTGLWQLYTEPKPKKIVHEWMIRDRGASNWWINDTLRTEEDMRVWAASMDYAEVRKTGRQFEVES